MSYLEVNRRVALQTLVSGAVGLATAGRWFEAVSAQDWTPKVFTARQNEMVVALTELIIPETTTPGAKATLVNRFIDAVLQQASTTERESFVRGLSWMDERSKTLFGKDFLAATAAEQTALLTRLAKEGGASAVEADDRPGADFFQAIKAMTISGYYTTEVGLHQELGDDGQLAMAEFRGCEHPEHQA
jgi:glucoside 3-dehydrogenase (cytochrome c) hitch-hiker subunit